MTMEMGDASEETDFEFTLILNEDGTGILQSDDDEDSNFTWSLIDGGFKTTGDMKLTFKEDGDNIRSTILGADIIFEKQ